MTRDTFLKAARTSYVLARRLATLVVGCSVVLFGVALIVLPGPAVVVIPAGLAILALEFAWAKRLLEHAKQSAAAGLDAITNSESAPK
jgi:uncharacterized protein (TIGR02611 family)